MLVGFRFLVVNATLLFRGRVYRLPECTDVPAFDRKQEYMPKEIQINPKKPWNNSFCGSDGPPAIFGGTLQVNKFQ